MSTDHAHPDWLPAVVAIDDALLHALVEALPEPCFLLDTDGRYVAVLGGKDSARYHDGRALVGKTMHEVMPSEYADRFLATVREAVESGRVLHCEYMLGSSDVDGVSERAGLPDRLWYEGHIAPLRPTPGRAPMAVWLTFNISEAKDALERLEQQQEALEAQQLELERLARTDPLTGLLNRRSFFEEVERELRWVRRTGEVAVLVTFDLDHFKTVNDTRGHAAGDAVLRAVGDLLRSDRRKTDVVARLGGEEFAIVVRGADDRAGAALAERLRSAIESLAVVEDGAPIALTASIGVTVLQPGDAEPDDALKRADRAMYRAKHLGRNRVELDV